MKLLELILAMLENSNRSFVVRYNREVKILVVYLIEIRNGRRFQIEHCFSLRQLHKIKDLALVPFLTSELELMDAKMQREMNYAEKEKAQRQSQD